MGDFYSGDIVYIANWHTGVIREREVLHRGKWGITIKTVTQGETRNVEIKQGGFVNVFTNRFLAASWIEEKRAFRVRYISGRIKAIKFKAEQRCLALKVDLGKAVTKASEPMTFRGLDE